jgi:hypothetical protein
VGVFLLISIEFVSKLGLFLELLHRSFGLKLTVSAETTTNSSEEFPLPDEIDIVDKQVGNIFTYLFDLLNISGFFSSSVMMIYSIAYLAVTIRFDFENLAIKIVRF